MYPVVYVRSRKIKCLKGCRNKRSDEENLLCASTNVNQTCFMGVLIKCLRFRSICGVFSDERKHFNWINLVKVTESEV